MSLLSATQGAPERVWTLLRLLSAHGGSLPRDEALGWLDPFESSKTAAEQTLQAGSSLGVVDIQAGIVSLTPEAVPSSIDGFADRAHARLASVASEDADSVLLEVMAWIVSAVEQHEGTIWLKERTAAALADEIDAGLPPATGGFNSTKFAPWKRWIEFVGLGFDSDTLGFYPAIASRLRRELAAFEPGRSIRADEFLARVARAMPYVDGGGLYEAAADRAKLTRTPPRLSRILSAALRELHDDEVLVLETLGDAASAVRLADDIHRVKTFLTVRIAKVGP